MEILKGKSVYGGIAIGKIKYWQKANHIVKRYHITNIQQEKERFMKTKIMTVQQLAEKTKAEKDAKKKKK